MEEAEVDVLAYMTFPAAHRAKLHSVNPLERLNGEIKRRTDVVGSRASLSTRQRGGHHPPGRRPPARAIRRVGAPARPSHDTGNHGAARRQYQRQPAGLGRLTKPAAPDIAAINVSYKSLSRFGLIYSERQRASISRMAADNLKQLTGMEVMADPVEAGLPDHAEALGHRLFLPVSMTTLHVPDRLQNGKTGHRSVSRQQVGVDVATAAARRRRRSGRRQFFAVYLSIFLGVTSSNGM